MRCACFTLIPIAIGIALKKNFNFVFFCFEKMKEGLGVNFIFSKLFILFEGGARGELKG